MNDVKTISECHTYYLTWHRRIWRSWICARFASGRRSWSSRQPRIGCSRCRRWSSCCCCCCCWWCCCCGLSIVVDVVIVCLLSRPAVASKVFVVIEKINLMNEIVSWISIVHKKDHFSALMPISFDVKFPNISGNKFYKYKIKTFKNNE